MLLKDKSEVLALNLKEAKDLLAEITMKYNIYTNFKDVPSATWELVDQITNSILWLEDRIYSIELSDTMREAQLKSVQTP
jgi:hypothetical protein